MSQVRQVSKNRRHALSTNLIESCLSAVRHTDARMWAHRKRTASAIASSARWLKEEFFGVAFRKTFYDSLDQLQADLERYLEFYNRERAHQGYRTQGRRPYEAFLDGIEAMQKTNVNPEAA